MRILVTGSRDWNAPEVIENAILDLNNWYPLDWDDSIIVHGDAPGADTQARQFAIACDIEHEAHPADWKKYGKAAGPKRNIEMLQTNPDIVLSFMVSTSKGTKHCTAEALKAGLPVRLFLKLTSLGTAQTHYIRSFSFNGALPKDSELNEEQLKSILHPYY